MNTRQNTIRNAVKIYMGIILYFFVMKLFGLEHVVQLRLFNFFIVLWGVNSAIKSNIFKNNDNFYLSNLSIGFATAVLSVLMITFSLILYINFIEPSFMEILETSFVWGANLSLGKIVFAILFEGMASSVICTFIVMQYWKKFKIESLF